MIFSDLTISFFLKLLTIFVPALVHSFAIPRKVIKRESGENPEQSRCCKLQAPPNLPKREA